MASVRHSKKQRQREESFLGLGKKAKEKRAQKQADKANGIKKPTAAGKLLGSLGIGSNAKKNQSSGGIANFGASLANSANKANASVGATMSAKKSTGEVVQNILEGVGSVAGAAGGVVGAIRNATGSGGGSYQEEGGVPEEEYDKDEPGLMDWLKKNWFIPVGVLVVGIGIYFFTRSNKTA